MFNNVQKELGRRLGRENGWPGHDAAISALYEAASFLACLSSCEHLRQFYCLLMVSLEGCNVIDEGRGSCVCGSGVLPHLTTSHLGRHPQASFVTAIASRAATMESIARISSLMETGT